MKSKLKHIGSLFLLLAGSVILAHALVPHHQHEGQPFFGISNCHHTHIIHHEGDDHTTACNHDHSENEGSDCALHHLLVIPGKQVKTQQAAVISCLIKNHSLATSESFTSQLITNFCDWRYHIEGTIPLPASIYASNIGLRAPPMV